MKSGRTYGRLNLPTGFGIQWQLACARGRLPPLFLYNFRLYEHALEIVCAYRYNFNLYMNLEFFAQSMAEICAHSLAAPGRPLRWIVIANPTAGGFTIRRRWQNHRRVLEAYCQKALENPPRENAAPAAAAARFDTPAALSARGMALTGGPGKGG